MDIGERDKKVEFVLIATLVLNWLVSFAKILLGFFTNTLSVMADGFHSLFDGFSNIVGLVGARFASKPADAKHPYGYRKVEHLVALLISLLLFLTAFTVLKGIYDRFVSPLEPEVSVISFAVLFGTLMINLFISRYEKKKGVELNSSILIADSVHTKTDVLITTSVILGLIGIILGFGFLDSAIALIVVILIGKTGLDIMKPSVKTLIDATPIDLKKIEEIASKVKGVTSIHAIKCRGDKNCTFVELHIRVDGKITVEEGHNLSHMVKKKITGAFPAVRDVTIHTEPESNPAK